MIKICQQCQNKFNAGESKNKFCSTSCYRQSRIGKTIKRKGIFKHCEKCGKEIYVPISWSYRRFCSVWCKAEFFRKGPRPNILEVKCKICGKQFKIKARGKITKRKYCSPECRKKASILPHPCRCRQCGKEFLSPPSSGYIRKFCSQECQRKQYTTITKRNGVRRFLERRGLIQKCEECEYDTHPEILMVHHKDGNGRNHSLDNLIVLCPNCHFIKHRTSHLPIST